MYVNSSNICYPCRLMKYIFKKMICLIYCKVVVLLFFSHRKTKANEVHTLGVICVCHVLFVSYIKCFLYQYFFCWFGLMYCHFHMSSAVSYWQSLGANPTECFTDLGKLNFLIVDRFTQLAQLPLKMALDLKKVIMDSKIIISHC